MLSVSRKLFASIVLIGGLGLSSLLPAQVATITPSFPNLGTTEDGLTASTSLTLRVEVTANTTPHPPLATALRVYFNSSAVSFNTATKGELGALQFSPADEDATVVTAGRDKFRDFATLGVDGFSDLDRNGNVLPFPPTLMTPRCFDVVFTVLPGATVPGGYTFQVIEDPGTDEVYNPAQDDAMIFLTLVPPAMGTIPLSIQPVPTINSVADWSLMAE